MVIVVVRVVCVVVAVLSDAMDVMDPPPSTFSIVRLSHNHNGGLQYGTSTLFFIRFCCRFVVDCVFKFGLIVITATATKRY
jgi:hypothetical protein